MERPIFKDIGTKEIELDTPGLMVDLDSLDYNLAYMNRFVESKGLNIKPYIGAHGSPAIAHKQIKYSSTSGITVSTLGQAEVFIEHGLNDVLIANIIYNKRKINRLCALAKNSNITLLVDNASNIADLSAAATSARVELNLLLVISSSTDSLGVEPGDNAEKMCQDIQKLPAINFTGLFGKFINNYVSESLPENNIYNKLEFNKINNDSIQFVQTILNFREQIETKGIEVNSVVYGCTYDYQDVASISGVTDIIAGSYALMDAKYKVLRTEFKNAASVMTCITSLPAPKTIITDGGRKAIGADLGSPEATLPGLIVKGLSAEHGNIAFDWGNKNLNLGDRIWCIPYDITSCVNLHDYIFGIRNGCLESIWDLPARGHYR